MWGSFSYPESKKITDGLKEYGYARSTSIFEVDIGSYRAFFSNSEYINKAEEKAYI